MSLGEPRAFLGIIRGVIIGSDDSKKMQTVDFRGLHDEMLTAERPQIYGVTSVPPKPDGNGANGAEVVVGFVNGNRSHPVVLSDGDARTRPKNLKPGESKHHDDQGQYSHLARDGHVAVAKNHSVTAGSQPDTGNHELQDQLKGLGAHVEQLAHTVHGLFDVTSRLNTIALPVIPGLAQLAPILNQDPSGLPIMAQAIQGKAVAYLQQHAQEALAKFTSPTIGSISSVLSGGIEGLISAAEAEIASVMAANPVVALVDGLVDELAGLNASGSPATIAVMAPTIQGLIDSATAINPVLGQVVNLRSTLASLMTSAGPGIGFLAPQQRMVQGLTKSLKLSQ